MNSMSPSHHRCFFIAQSFIFKSIFKGSDVFLYFSQRFFDKKRESCVDNIVGCQAKMNKTGVFAHFFSHRSEESNHIMFHDFFNLFDLLYGKACFVFNPFKSLRRDFTCFCPGFTDSQLNIEPFLVFVFFGPDGAHLGTRVSFNHGKKPRKLGKRITVSLSLVNVLDTGGKHLQFHYKTFWEIASLPSDF
ncbi:hypothetical protein ES703_92676 [subsurface metagenome]